MVRLVLLKVCPVLMKGRKVVGCEVGDDFLVFWGGSEVWVLSAPQNRGSISVLFGFPPCQPDYWEPTIWKRVRPGFPQRSWNVIMWILWSAWIWTKLFELKWIHFSTPFSLIRCLFFIFIFLPLLIFFETVVFLPSIPHVPHCSLPNPRPHFL